MGMELMNFDPRAAALIKRLCDSLDNIKFGSGSKRHLVEFAIVDEENPRNVTVAAEEIAAILPYDGMVRMYIGTASNECLFFISGSYEEAVKKWKEALEGK